MGAWLTLALCLAASLAACGSSMISAGEFDRSCSQDADCVAIGVGDFCECSCESGAINVADLPKYQERLSGISCSVDCGPCPDLPDAFCDMGTCATR